MNYGHKKVVRDNMEIAEHNLKGSFNAKRIWCNYRN